MVAKKIRKGRYLAYAGLIIQRALGIERRV